MLQMVWRLCLYVRSIYLVNAMQVVLVGIAPEDQQAPRHHRH